MVNWGLDFEFGVGLKLGLELGLQFELSLRLGLGATIAFFLFERWRANKPYLFQMIEFYVLLAGNKARAEVLPLPYIGQPIYISRSHDQAGISYRLPSADIISA